MELGMWRGIYLDYQFVLSLDLGFYEKVVLIEGVLEEVQR